MTVAWHHEQLSQGKNAPGKPGLAPRWASAAKSGVGTALTSESNIWFTISRGIVTEVFHPSVDTACIRDCGLLVTDRQSFFSEERRDTSSTVAYMKCGVPAFQLTNTCNRGRYRIEKAIVSDPLRPTLLQQIDFVPLDADLADYSVFVLLNPHLRNQESPNRAWCGQFKGVPMLFAQSDSEVMALACSAPWLKRSVGFVGVSDGWQDISKHKRMVWSYDFADDGNVAVCGEIDLLGQNGHFLLALSFGTDEGQAGYRARASLLQGFDAARKVYIAQWTKSQEGVGSYKGGASEVRDCAA